METKTLELNQTKKIYSDKETRKMDVLVKILLYESSKKDGTELKG